MTPTNFINDLKSIKLDYVFNPYSERCDIFDRADAPERRRANLRAVLNASLDYEIDSVWIARDLGYRGGRRTGLPLTDEIHLEAFSQCYGGLPLVRAAIIWQVLAQINKPIFLWNIFPLHPFEPGDPMSNRCHTRVEREACQGLLFELLGMLRPKRVVAIGRDAQNSLAGLGLESYPVRHPSYGGQTDFVKGMRELYGFPDM